ncbi:uncharacterized protein TNCV_4937201 [Trichonephila clavipes]|nr:uncharacterized protein TNCV_4937201 [Trichonephila clavipes]
MCQNEMNDLIFKDENAEQLFETDFLSAGNYRDRCTELCAKIDLETSKIVTSLCKLQTQFKLPKIELKKFSGYAKEYLTFWTQFRNIDEDSSIPQEEKFQYLLQAVVPKSKAARMVESFPATMDKNQKAIAQLKDRFGREDILVQIYVRDLLSMVMKNAVSCRVTTDLPSLYDDLESKIRSLERLVRTQEK